MVHSHQQSNISFYGLGIAPKILELLDRMKFTVPTPIQHKAIPIAIEGKDVIGVAQTGTGKTLAFAIPIIQRLAQAKGRCLILVPTRELALQVDETFQKLAHLFSIHTAVLIGGASMHLQLQSLRKNPRVLIATPGRLVDHINQRTVLLADVTMLVLDEADRMLDMGFLPQIEQILKRIPANRQTMLFSATIPKEIINIATAHMKLPVHIEIAPSGTTAERIVQELFIVKKEAKKQLLGKLLAQYQGSVLLFSRTKIGATKITRFLRTSGYNAAEIHSNRSLPQRREALEGFKSGKYRVLVATDIAARGIDVTGIELVINYDLPEDSENYVHRIGRTGRAGHEGRAISFATPDQEFDVRSIEKLIKIVLPVSKHPELPGENFSKNPAPRQRFGRRTFILTAVFFAAFSRMTYAQDIFEAKNPDEAKTSEAKKPDEGAKPPEAAVQAKKAQEAPEVKPEDKPEDKKPLNADDVQKAFEKAMKAVDAGKLEEEKKTEQLLNGKLKVTIEDWLSAARKRLAPDLNKMMNQKWEKIYEFGPYVHYDYYLRDYEILEMGADIAKTDSVLVPYTAYLNAAEKLYVEKYHTPDISYIDDFLYTVTYPIKVEIEYRGGEFRVLKDEYGEPAIEKGWPAHIRSRLRDKALGK